MLDYNYLKNKRFKREMRRKFLCLFKGDFWRKLISSGIFIFISHFPPDPNTIEWTFFSQSQNMSLENNTIFVNFKAVNSIVRGAIVWSTRQQQIFHSNDKLKIADIAWSEIFVVFFRYNWVNKRIHDYVDQKLIAGMAKKPEMFYFECCYRLYIIHRHSNHWSFNSE